MPPPTQRDPLLPAEGPATNTMNNTMNAPTNSGSHMANTVESWVEIASQPSSSSLSSIADEIVITGLRVGSNATGVNGGAMPASTAQAQQPQPQRRRRLLQQVEAAAGRPPTSHPTNLPSTTTAAGPAPRSSAGSSQEEYDETESEEDRVLSSSTEHLDMGDVSRPTQSYSLMQYQVAQARLRQRAAVAASDGDDEDDDDDDDGTALGILSRESGPPTFRPQPNAFSHPPTHMQQPTSHRSVPTPSQTPSHMAAGGPYAPRPSRPSRNSAPNFMSPSYREDNDAALRASLTTLLSCAAAARGLPKKESNNGISGGPFVDGGEPSSSSTNTGVRPSNQPMGLRLVPESELMDDNDNSAPVSPRTRTPFQPPRMPPQVSSNTQTARPSASSSSNKQHAASSSTQQQQQQHHSSRNSAVSAVSTSSKSKRTSASKSSPRVTKKKRTSTSNADTSDGVTMISPTLLTWVVSAGVVVLVSVVGFGAGFVIGREVGRQEAASSMSAAAAGSSMPTNASSASTSCGREIMRSSTGSTLRRFRWGGMTKSVAA